METKQNFFSDLLQCTSHLNFFFILFKPLIKIIQVSPCSLFFFSFFYSRPHRALSSSEDSYYFFFSSSQALSSALISQALISLQSRRHPNRRRRVTHAVPAHASARRHCNHLSDLSQALISQPTPSSSPSPSPYQPSPSPSPSPSHTVLAHASARSTSGQCSLFFCSEFFNCCFGLIFLGLVLFCGEKWCCPYVVLGKIKKTFVLE